MKRHARRQGALVRYAGRGPALPVDENRRVQYWKLEALEPRVLLSATVVPISQAPDSNWQIEMLADAGGNLWFNQGSTNSLLRVAPDGTTTAFVIPTPDAQPGEMAQSADGSIWFAESNQNKVGRVNNGTVLEYSLPSGNTLDALAVGSDGNVYFTAENADETQGSFGFITPAGQLTETALPDDLCPMSSDSLVADGNAMWFAANDAGGNDVLVKAASRKLSEFSLNSSDWVYSMAVATDGSLWLDGASAMWHVTGDGTVHALNDDDFPVTDLVGASDGGVWYGPVNSGHLLAHMDAEGTVTEVNDAVGVGVPTAACAGPAGQIWVLNSDETEAYLVDPAHPPVGPLQPLQVFGMSDIDASLASIGGSVAQFSDPNESLPAADYSAVLTFSDGTSAAGMVVSSDGGLYDVKTAADWPLDASYVDVSISGSDGASGTARGYPEINYYTQFETDNATQFMVSDAGGNVYFTDIASNSIGVVAPDGSQRNYAIPTAGAAPAGLAIGGDGNIWFTESATDKVGLMTPSGQMTEYSLAALGGEPGAIAAAPDGSLWFTIAPTLVSLQYISPTPTPVLGLGHITADGQTSFLPIPALAEMDPYSIAVTPDGDIWFLTVGGVMRMTPSGASSLIAIDPPYFWGVANNLTAAADGGVWISASGAIDHVSAAGVVTSISLGYEGFWGQYAAPAADGGVWFSGDNGNDLYRLDADGTIDAYAAPGPASLMAWLPNPPVTPIGAVLPVGDKLYYMTNADGAIHSVGLTTDLVGTDLLPTVLTGSPVAATLARFSVPMGAVADPADFQAVITWPDGSTSAGQITPDPAGGFDVSGVFSWPIDDQPYALFGRQPTMQAGVTILDAAGNAIAEVNSLVSYTNPQPTAQGIDQQVTAGQVFGGVVAQFGNVATDGSFQFQQAAYVNWGDGTGSVAVVTPDGQNQVSVSAQHVYAQPGTYTCTVQLWPGFVWFTPLAQASFSVTVAGGIMTGTGQTLTAGDDEPVGGVVADFTPADPGIDLSHLHAQVVWGIPDFSSADLSAGANTFAENAQSPGTIQSDGAGGFSVSAATVFQNWWDGSLPFAIVITDDRLGSGPGAIVGVAYGEAVLDTDPVATQGDGSTLTPVVAAPSPGDGSDGSGDGTDTGDGGDGASAGDDTTQPFVWHLAPVAGYTLASGSSQWLRDQWSLIGNEAQNLFGGN